MRLRDLVFNVLLISIVRFSTALPPLYPPTPDRLLILRLLPESVRTLHSIPDRWRIMHHPPFRAPQMEIQMMKGEVSPDENWMFANEYKYSGRDYESPTLRINDKKIEHGNVKANENEKSNNADIQENIPLSDNWVPPIGSRNVIAGPQYCDKGQRMDINGKCRGVIESRA
ncbi:hypothetical protein DMN91_013013 [Ooceraea biroi]|uniref:Uncharacterized protein n=1 Tax=Ooceraea biroi TaxID=2015173 RepID=A0A026W281_OOCBI|nr:uncharacterized protein LOC105284453 [Ooceraea biroi]EZA49706.1 hypothetical protein X777_11792 [Ooceraea biroi]RLU15126.1 hypothetical protein DMN91_013013 [Ooceraea biroi]